MMQLNRKMSPVSLLLSYGVLILVGLLIIYPLIWLFFAGFKPNHEIFDITRLLPREPVFTAFAEGWKGSGQVGFGRFYLNTFILVVPVVAFTLTSCVLVAYGFTRFRFPGKRFFFILMMSTLMLPTTVILIPRYMLFNTFGWIDSYLPFIIPAAFADESFFIFMMVQFLRGVPFELDESAYMDGAGSFKVLTRIIAPLCKPAFFSVCIFRFMWSWNDFFNPKIFINSVKKFPISLGLELSLDTAGVVNWSSVFAMTLLAIIPGIVIFFVAQKHFVEGISTSGIKG